MPAISDRPKAMAQVAGRPFLEWLLLSLLRNGVARVTLCTGYMSGLIKDHFGDGTQLGMRIAYSQEAAPLGTGGAVRAAAEERPARRYLVLNGDSYCAFDLPKFVTEHKAKNARASLWLTQVRDSLMYGRVGLGYGMSIESFAEKSPVGGPALVNAGVYLLEAEVVHGIEAGRPVSLEREVLPGLVGKGLYGVPGNGPFIDIGTPSSYIQAEDLLREELSRLESESRSPRDVAQVAQRLLETSALQRRIAEELPTGVMAAARVITECFKRGGKIMLCGNGGSAADCQHMAAEFVSLLSPRFERPALPALALTTDTSFLTAFANDRGFEGIFERQLRALGRPSDILIAISTSGTSRNVVRAVNAARELGITTVGLLGEGGVLTSMVDWAIVVPSRNTQLVQEGLLPIEHVICDLVERSLYASSDQI